MEDKQKICDQLVTALELTRALYDLENLEYNPQSETVRATFTTREHKIVNVAADSGIAMIRDIIQQIV